MSLEPRADDGVPELTARVVRAAFPKGTLAIRIREALGPLLVGRGLCRGVPPAWPSRGLAGCPGAGVGAAVRGGAVGPAGR